MRDADLAKIGCLYLYDEMWNGQRIVSRNWVKQSLKPLIDAARPLSLWPISHRPHVGDSAAEVLEFLGASSTA
jgi:hypothetical protein